MVMFGRNSESPVPVVAASTPAGCFHAAIEAARIAIKYRTPVFLLSDAYLANGSEPWLIPDVSALADISTEFASEANGEEGFLPYKRDPETLARPWAIPGTPGLEHRIGGLEKENETGNVSYDPENHDLMVQLRAAKVAGIAADIPELEVDDPDGADDTCPRLGLDLRRDRCGRTARSRERAQGRDRASAPPESVPAAIPATSCARTTRCSCRRSTSASSGCFSAPSISSTRWATTRYAGARSARRSSRTRSRLWWTLDQRAPSARVRQQRRGNQVSPCVAPFFLKTWGTSRFPTPLHAHRPETGR